MKQARSIQELYKKQRVELLLRSDASQLLPGVSSCTFPSHSPFFAAYLQHDDICRKLFSENHLDPDVDLLVYLVLEFHSLVGLFLEIINFLR